jgi:hypothetical protein
MTAALSLMMRPTVDGWGVYLTNGHELARYRGFCSKQLALRYLQRCTRSLSRSPRPSSLWGRRSSGRQSS